MPGSHQKVECQRKRSFKGFPAGKRLHASLRTIVMIDHIQFQTTLTLPVIRISLAVSAHIVHAHHHKPRICTGNDPVKIIGLDVGLKLDLFLWIRL